MFDRGTPRQAEQPDDWVPTFLAHVKTTEPHVRLELNRTHIDHGGHVVLVHIEIAPVHRRKGIARRIVTTICLHADQHGDTLSVTPAERAEGPPTPWQTASRTRWRRFFTTEMGFRLNKGSKHDAQISELMYRLPRPTNSI